MDLVGRLPARTAPEFKGSLEPPSAAAATRDSVMTRATRRPRRLGCAAAQGKLTCAWTTGLPVRVGEFARSEDKRRTTSGCGSAGSRARGRSLGSSTALFIALLDDPKTSACTRAKRPLENLERGSRRPTSRPQFELHRSATWRMRTPRRLRARREERREGRRFLLGPRAAPRPRTSPDSRSSASSPRCSLPRIDDGRWRICVSARPLSHDHAFRRAVAPSRFLAFGSDGTSRRSRLSPHRRRGHRRPLDGNHPNGWIPIKDRRGVGASSYTSTAAHAGSRRGQGSLAVGNLALRHALAGRPVDPVVEIPDARFVRNVVGGRIVYSP